MKHRELTRKVIGCAMEIHSTLGNGFQELIYQRALAYELSIQNIQFAREVNMEITYKGIVVGTRRVDFMINNILCVEIKAVKELNDIHLAQAINYLEAYDLEIGLLINFGSNSLGFKRLHNNKLEP